MRQRCSQLARLSNAGGMKARDDWTPPVFSSQLPHLYLLTWKNPVGHLNIQPYRYCT